MIKNILAFLGAVFLVLLVSAMALWIRWGQARATAEAYTRQSIVSIFETWDFEKLMNRAAPVMLLNNSETALHALFDSMKPLGKYQSIEDCQGQSTLNFTGDKPLFTAQYTCSVNFEKDTAGISLVLLSNLIGPWKIGTVQLQSDYLVKQHGGK